MGALGLQHGGSFADLPDGYAVDDSIFEPEDDPDGALPVRTRS